MMVKARRRVRRVSMIGKVRNRNLADSNSECKHHVFFVII